MIKKDSNTCLCAVCNEVFLENKEDQIFRSMRGNKNFVENPGSIIHFGEHISARIHEQCVPKYCEKHPDYQDPPHQNPPQKKQSASSLFSSSTFSPFSSTSSPSSPSPSLLSPKFGIPTRFYKKSTSSFKISPPTPPPAWLRLLVKISFMIVFFIVQEKMSDNSFKRFLDFASIILNALWVS